MGDETMDDMQEQMDVANQISEAMGQPIGDAMQDDDELLDELDELGEDEAFGELDEIAAPAPAVEQKIAAPVVPQPSIGMPAAPDDAIMPSAPQGDVNLAEEDDEAAAL